MSKLRLVKERSADRNEAENDLRGLADKGLLELQYPWVYLATKNLSTQVVKQVCQQFHLHAKEEKGGHVLFFVHRQELVKQIKDSFKQQGVDLNHCTIMTVGKVANRLKILPKPNLIIVDVSLELIIKLVLSTRASELICIQSRSSAPSGNEVVE